MNFNHDKKPDVDGRKEADVVEREEAELQFQSGDGTEGSQQPQDCNGTEANFSLAGEGDEEKTEGGEETLSAEYENGIEEGPDPLDCNVVGEEEANDASRIVSSQTEDMGSAEAAEEQMVPMEVEKAVELDTSQSLPRKRKKEDSISPTEEQRKGDSEEEEGQKGSTIRKVKGRGRAGRIVSNESESDDSPSENPGRAGRAIPFTLGKAIPSTSGTARYMKGSESEAVTVSSDEVYVPYTRAAKRNKALAPRKKRKVETKRKDRKEPDPEGIREGENRMKGAAEKAKEMAKNIGTEKKEEVGGTGTKGQKSQKKKNNLSDKDDTPDADKREGSIVLGTDEYSRMTAAAVGALALERLEEVDTGRAKSSNIQGRISGMMRSNISKLKNIVRALVGKAEASGDPLYLRMRNAELSMQMKEMKEKCERNGSDLVEAKRTIQEMKEERAKAEKNNQQKGSENGRDRMRKDCGRRKDIGKEEPSEREGRDVEAESVESGNRRENDVVWRPPLKGTSAPIPTAADNRDVAGKNKNKEREAIISKQIEELLRARKQLRKDLSQDRKKSISKAEEEENEERNDARKGGRKKLAGLRIISDVQIAPPALREETGPHRDYPLGEGGCAGHVANEGTELEPEVSARNNRKGRDEDWETAGRRSRKGKQSQRQKEAPQRNNEVRRRPPRTAVVSITGKTEGFSYAEAVRKARGKISLSGIGIEQTKIRRAINGGILVEIIGPDGKEKANALADKLREVLPEEEAVVARPVVKGELRIIGVDDSVTCDEVKDVVTSMGDCTLEETRTGELRRLSNGLNTIWVQCPLAAATRIAREGKLRIGWTIARVELLRARPLQCYRCWEFGHVRNSCKSSMDRSMACYRCGETGHRAGQCTTTPKCLVCAEKGKDGRHRLGSAGCTERKKFTGKPARRTGLTDAADNGN